MHLVKFHINNEFSNCKGKLAFKISNSVMEHSFFEKNSKSVTKNHFFQQKQCQNCADDSKVLGTGTEKHGTVCHARKRHGHN